MGLWVSVKGPPAARTRRKSGVGMVRLPKSVNPEAALRQSAGARCGIHTDARIPTAYRAGGASIACAIARLISACRKGLGIRGR